MKNGASAGASLSQPASTPLDLPPVELVYICSNCGQSDPLNAAYCVFCAGKTVAAPQTSRGPQSLRTHLDQLGSSGNMQALSKAVPSASAAIISVLLTVLCAVCGLAAGAALIFGPLQEKLVDSFARSSWPPNGLLVYTEKPFAEVRVESSDKQTVMVGQTGETGALTLESLPPGEYTVHIMNGKTRAVSEQAHIERGRPTILGFPERLKI